MNLDSLAKPDYICMGVIRLCSGIVQSMNTFMYPTRLCTDRLLCSWAMQACQCHKRLWNGVSGLLGGSPGNFHEEIITNSLLVILSTCIPSTLPP